MTTAEEVRRIREEAFDVVAASPSDINEHMRTLRRLASECSHVTEMGMRRGLSTLALLAAQPKTLISWDIDPRAILSEQCATLHRLAGETNFQPRCGNTLEISPIEPTDMLFIDTLHTFAQLKAELWRHVFPDHFTGKCLCRVKRYIVFHDTETFGYVGEDKKQPGLLTAIEWFQRNAMPIWGVVEKYENCNGLLVLRHA